jgi:hypothetical protein
LKSQKMQVTIIFNYSSLPGQGLSKFIIFGEPFRTNLKFIDRKVVGLKPCPGNEE